MFGRKKKNEDKKRKAVELEAVRLAALNPDTKIFAMPAKFWLPEEPKKIFWTAGKVWGLVILALVLLIGAVYLLLVGTAPQEALTLEPENEQAVPAALPAESDLLTDTDDSRELPAEVIAIEDENNVVPEIIEPLPPAIAPKGPDQDGDGLTDAEEALFGTDPQLTDSDGDTFLDSIEIKNGYNPAGPGLLSETDLFTTYINTSGGYSLNHPVAWQPISSGQQGVQFATGTGEVVLILLQTNPSSLPLRDWYDQVNTSTIDPKSATIGNIVGLHSADERTFYFEISDKPNVVFVANHAIGSKSSVDFSSTLEIMLNSLSVIEE